MRLLTITEAADYMSLKDRKLYELASEGSVPCTKITGRWLFPKHELDRWLSRRALWPNGVRAPDPMPIIGGSHDPLLEWALRESGSGLATLPEGSAAGLSRFIRGELVGAAVHMHVREIDVDGNIEAMQTRPNLYDAVLIAFARREQGLVVARRNPLALTNVEQVVSSRARLAPRPGGAGAQLLLHALLHRVGLSPDQLNRITPTCPTGPDVAQAIRAGRADCGVATRSVANAAGLDFVPLAWEHFDLIVQQRQYFHGPLQAFFHFLHTPLFLKRAEELGGYDVSEAGIIRYTP